ncbi:hypothetical protein FHS07_000693 [Microbacterium proteolyticum]|uniref:Uncharacterized protein n=1 Tax=Microbacterium proteolyticum TaxID=1572644 RepID=A0A7W5CHI9_9MICO|nr:hypothetical protein [Microbacterium proteolyticum]MBB3157009.1 hypothetical protein [Microbacterium proteolyticum]
MRMLTRLPLGAILSAMAAMICAVPTLVLPADSPNAPKVALLAIAAVVFIVGVVRVRSEEGPRPHPGSEITSD